MAPDQKRLRSIGPARVTLALGAVLTILAVALTLTGSPLRVVSVGAKSQQTLGSTTTDTTVCQSGESLPGGLSAIRLGLEGPVGPPVLLRAFSQGRVITEGSRAPNWTDSSVTIPVKPLQHSVKPVKLCFYVNANSELLKLYGVHTTAQEAARGKSGQVLPGRFSVEYLAPSDESWWSRAFSVARHMGVGHAITGTWVALLVAVIVAAAASLILSLAWKELP
jgi:hypothetical protein